MSICHWATGVVAALMVAASPAWAQTLPPCKTSGDEAAKGVSYRDATRLVQLAESLAGKALKSGVMDLAATPATCERATARIDDADYRLSGENGDRAARRLLPKAGAGRQLLLLDFTKTPGDSGAESEARPYGLVGVDGFVISLYALFDKIPDDDEMVSLAQQVLGRGGPGPMMVVDGNTGELRVHFVARPVAQARPQTPDGNVFVEAPNGGVRHAATGFVCPADVDGLKRSRFYIFDASDHGRDVGCNFGTANQDGAWYSIYLTRLPSTDVKTYMRASILDAQRLRPAIGEADALLAPGAPPLPSEVRFWMSDVGKEGLLVRKSGDWLLTIRVTVQSEDDAKVVATLKHLLDMLLPVGAIPV